MVRVGLGFSLGLGLELERRCLQWRPRNYMCHRGGMTLDVRQRSPDILFSPLSRAAHVEWH